MSSQVAVARRASLNAAAAGSPGMAAVTFCGGGRGAGALADAVGDTARSRGAVAGEGVFSGFCGTDAVGAQLAPSARTKQDFVRTESKGVRVTAV